MMMMMMMMMMLILMDEVVPNFEVLFQGNEMSSRGRGEGSKETKAYFT